MITTPHTKKLDVSPIIQQATYKSGIKISTATLKAFTPTITTWQAIPSGSQSTGSGRSMMDGVYSYNLGLGQNNGCLNSRIVSSAWCNFTLDGGSGALLTKLYYSLGGADTSLKKVRYIYLYSVGAGGSLTLIQQLNTVTISTYEEWLTLATPYEFSGVREFRIVASTSWGDPYIWVTEIVPYGYML